MNAVTIAVQPKTCSIATFSLLKCVQNFRRRHLPSSHFFYLPPPRHAPNEIMRTYKQMNELIKNITDTEFGTCSIAHPQSSSTYSTYSSVQLAFWNSIYFHLKDHFLLRYIQLNRYLLAKDFCQAMHCNYVLLVGSCSTFIFCFRHLLYSSLSLYLAQADPLLFLNPHKLIYHLPFVNCCFFCHYLFGTQTVL